MANMEGANDEKQVGNCCSSGNRLKNKMKILHIITNSVRRSGPEQLLLAIINKMDSARFTNRIVMLQDSKFFGKSLLEESPVPDGWIQAIPWSKKNIFPDSIRRLQKIINAEDIDVIHCHCNRSTLLGLLVGKNRGLPLVRSMHGTLEYTLKLKMISCIDMTLLKFFDRVIIGSDEIKKKLGNIRSDKIVTIPNAVTFETSSRRYDLQAMRAKLNIAAGEKVISTVGRLHPEKGHIYLLEAAREVCRKITGIKFLIVGEGPLKSELKEMTKKLGLNRCVNFTGYYPDIKEILSVSDLFVHPSIEESLPLSVLEAMVCSRPVVATDVGGTRDAVIDGVNGLLVASKSPGQLSESIMDLLNDPVKMKTMGESGLSIVREKFSIEKYIKRLQEMYDELL